MKTCNNCQHQQPFPIACKEYTGAGCVNHKPIIPTAAQAFVICNGKVRVWAVQEKGTIACPCKQCDFESNACNDDPCRLCNLINYYRIVAVEMVEGK